MDFLAALEVLNFSPMTRFDKIPTTPEEFETCLLVPGSEDPSAWPATFEQLQEEMGKARIRIAQNMMRRKRDSLLMFSDSRTTPDFPHKDEAEKQAWLDYRQALRDLPENCPDITLKYETPSEISLPPLLPKEVPDSLQLNRTLLKDMTRLCNVTWPIPPVQS